MSFDIRILNKAYKEILTLRLKIASLLKVQKLLNHENESLSPEDTLYLPKPVLVYLLILNINKEKSHDLTIYCKYKKRALNALDVLLGTLNDKKAFLEKQHKITNNQELQLIQIESKKPLRKVYTSPTHRQMAQEIIRKFREKNEKKEKV